MAALDPSDLKAKLTSKFGFAAAGSGRGPHDKFRLYVDGRWVAQTQVPRGSKPINDKLAGMIARQVGVTSRQLRDMIGCSIGRQAYLELVDTD